MTKLPTKRCAIYTRKSSEEGLEQDFNSLHAQRESCEAFIKSQQSEGWRLVHTAYDDGGISGGTMERPALRQLLTDIGVGKIDVVVVYKVDRLTRSLADFAKMVEVFDAKGVSFVAVTQQFNTTSSMGRLTLNVLLSFAQFEREVTGERIRDKIAASKAKGMWMGGYVPLGYDARDRKLVVNNDEAEIVRTIFTLYDQLGSVRLLKKELDRLGIRSRPRGRDGETTKPGCSFARGGLYLALGNPVYIGVIRHKDITHPGQHEAIVDRALWDSVQAKLIDKTKRLGAGRKTPPSPLIGKLFDEANGCLTPTHAHRHGKRYRYYASPVVLKGEAKQNQGWRVPAPAIEKLVADTARSALLDQAAITHALQEAGTEIQDLRPALRYADGIATRLNDEATRAEALAAVIVRVNLWADGIKVALKTTLGEVEVALTRSVSMRMKRRGSELRMVVDGQRYVKADQVLIRAIGRAHRWVDQLVAGKSVREIARDEGHTTAQYVRRVLPLAFLAPSIVESIMNGAQPTDLTANRLLHGASLDPNWEGQRKALGFTG